MYQYQYPPNGPQEIAVADPIVRSDRCCSVRIIHDVLRSALLVWPYVRHELVHFDPLPSKDLGDRVM